MTVDRAIYNQGINAQYQPQITEEGIVATMVARGPSAVCYPANQIGGEHCGSNPKPGDPCLTLQTREPVLLCMETAQVNGIQNPVVYPIDQHQQDARFRLCKDGIVPTLSRQMGTGGNNTPTVLTDGQPQRKYILRRLTPLECERLQGLPDQWTQVPYRGKPMSDSARYRMCGNGIAVPCAEFIFGQIAEYEKIESNAQKRQNKDHIANKKNAHGHALQNQFFARNLP